jgi:hypothetical protein
MNLKTRALVALAIAFTAGCASSGNHPAAKVSPGGPSHTATSTPTPGSASGKPSATASATAGTPSPGTSAGSTSQKAALGRPEPGTFPYWLDSGTQHSRYQLTIRSLGNGRYDYSSQQPGRTYTDFSTLNAKSDGLYLLVTGKRGTTNTSCTYDPPVPERPWRVRANEHWSIISDCPTNGVSHRLQYRFQVKEIALHPTNGLPPYVEIVEITTARGAKKGCGKDAKFELRHGLLLDSVEECAGVRLHRYLAKG